MKNIKILFLILLLGCSDPAAVERLRKEERHAKMEQEQRYWAQVAFSVKNAITPFHPKVRSFALRMAGLFPGKYNFGQVCAIWYYLKNHWMYVDDPRAFDYFAPAFESIEANLSGDCDDFAIMMASSIESIGGLARVVLSYDKDSAHAYCEVYVSDNPGHVRGLIEELAHIDTYRDILGEYPEKLGTGDYRIHFHKDRDGYWLNLDYSADYPGGPFPSAMLEIAVYSDGNWELLG